VAELEDRVGLGDVLEPVLPELHERVAVVDERSRRR
jgi:hypothetical protein